MWVDFWLYEGVSQTKGLDRMQRWLLMWIQDYPLLDSSHYTSHLLLQEPGCIIGSSVLTNCSRIDLIEAVRRPLYLYVSFSPPLVLLSWLSRHADIFKHCLFSLIMSVLGSKEVLQWLPAVVLEMGDFFRESTICYKHHSTLILKYFQLKSGRKTTTGYFTQHISSLLILFAECWFSIYITVLP